MRPFDQGEALVRGTREVARDRGEVAGDIDCRLPIEIGAPARRQTAAITPVHRGWVLLVIGVIALAACTGQRTSSPTTAAPPSSTAPDGVVGGPPPSSATRPLRNDQPWPVHAIDSRFRGANALGRADVDGDGRDDYVTNYEFDQRAVISFAPPAGGDLTAPWSTMTWFCPTADPATKGCDTESAALADLDGDGNLDLVISQGGHPDRVFDGDEPGIRVVWGPARDRVREPAAWQDGGRIPATVDQGHYLYQQPYDVNGDGALDVVVGGRVYFGNGNKAGIAWLEAPKDPAQRRDLVAWQLHRIDPDTFDGHGFVLTDLDGDGDPDLVDANADFDTPEDQEAVFWYRNPGPSSPDLTAAWPRTELVRDPGFYGKPQIDVADMNGDGRDDLVTQTVDDFLFFLRRPGDDVDFDLVRVRKPDELRWPTRGLKIGDLDGDGRPDLVGMMTHDDSVLPAGRPSVYWLSFDGGRMATDALTVHPIKWSPGTVSATKLFGEKWDQVDLRDVDGDGDVDIVANEEEWMQDPDGDFVLYDPAGTDGESVAVVWFENRLGDEAPSCQQDGASGCGLEAEAPTQVRDGTWIERNTVPGASGGRYLQAFNSVDPASCPATPEPTQSVRDCPPRPDGVLEPGDSDGVRYRAELDGGRYDVWVRVFAPERFGNGMGGARSDSAYVSVDDAAPMVVGDAGVPFGAWTWVRLAAPVDLGAGAHDIGLQVRERGVAVDRLVLMPAGSPPPP